MNNNTIRKNMFSRTPDKIVAICDMDEILVDISPEWCKRIHDNKDKYSDYLDIDDRILDKKHVLRRKTFKLQDWLVKEGIEMPKEIFDDIFKIYSDDINFYDGLAPTDFCLALHGLAMTSRVEKIYVLTRSVDSNWKSKIKFLEDHFYVDGKVEIIKVPFNMKKSSVINELIPDVDKVNLLIDDELSNIEDIIDNTILKDKPLVVMFPAVGYGPLNMDNDKLDYYEEKLNKEFLIYR